MQLQPQGFLNCSLLRADQNANDSALLDQILVIIPILNEASTISTVIQSLYGLGLRTIRIVDNGSTDNSITEARRAGADVWIEPIAGYGQACWCGLQQIPDPIRWILFCDGDGSDDLSELPQFFAVMEQADLILGNRRATSQGRSALTPVQNFGNSLATLLMSWGWGYRYQDLGPLRLIRRTALEAMQMSDRSFGWTVEMQAKAIELKLRICELPVNYRPRQGGRSKISGTLIGSVKAGTVILSTLGKLYGQRLLQGRLSQEHLSQDLQAEDLQTEDLRARHRNVQFLLVWVSAVLLLAGCIWMAPHGDFRQVGAVDQFWVGAGLMGGGFLLSGLIHKISRLWFWGVALLSRLLLLPMYPGDDIWRYLWEGYIQTLGFSPYQWAPIAPELEPYRTAWWTLINNGGTSAIYPPIAQLGFRLLAVIMPSVLLFKLAFVAADVITCWLLSRRFGLQKALIYGWNPLVIYAFAGGGHYDSWFILPVVAAWVICCPKNWSWSAVLLGISIAIKWISLPILVGLAWLQLPRFRGAIAVFFLGSLPLILSALPFCSWDSCSLIPTRSGFVSHGRSAEFFPYILHQLWPQLPAKNSIYLIPLVLVLTWIIVQDYWQTFIIRLNQTWTERFLNFSQAYLVSLIVLSPIVHAWYFTWLVPFAVVTQNLGIRLVSVSAFVYFALQKRQALGDFSWHLTLFERFLMWS
ncbi:MAG: glycosyltransferase family 2 protein, partial [Microcoleaceae cyanobacterium]